MHCVGKYPTEPNNLELNQIDLFKSKVQKARNETVFNFGQSGIKGAQEIVKILHEKKAIKN